jgi:hypothetical protein
MRAQLEISMSSLAIESHLIELLLHMQQENIPLIIAGGLGIYLKHRWVLEQVETGERVNLFETIPDARATDDIDAFLEIHVFLQPTRGEFRQVLSTLGYECHTNYLMFKKSFRDGSGLEVKLDLLAPLSDDPRLKVDKPGKPGAMRRIGPTDNKASAAGEMLHAYATPEAFAIEEGPLTLPLAGRTPSGDEFVVDVRVPHPFASLCMKIKAAWDHEHTQPAQRKPRGQKHAQDVYLLMAMLSRDEWEECAALRDQFADHAELQLVRTAVAKLFATTAQPGCVTIAANLPNTDLDRFTAVISELFAV